MVKFVLSFGIYQMTMLGLFQAQIIDGETLRAFEQYPLLLVVIGVIYYLQKTQREDAKERRRQQVEDAKENREWLEKMLEAQHVNLTKIYESQQVFVTALLNQMELKQDGMARLLEQFRQQMAVNTTTVSEISSVEAIVSELIGRLEKK